MSDAPAAVRAALATVNDPEYPDLSILDLGLVESIDVHPVDAGDPDTPTSVTVGLIPTFSGCPALSMIGDDVRVAVEALPDVTTCQVEWLHAPTWNVDRTTRTARRRLRREYTVVVRRPDGSLQCPVCGSERVEDQSMAGPTRCRSVAWCGDCRNVIEVMRTGEGHE